MKQTPLFKL